MSDTPRLMASSSIRLTKRTTGVSSAGLAASASCSSSSGSKAAMSNSSRPSPSRSPSPSFRAGSVSRPINAASLPCSTSTGSTFRPVRKRRSSMARWFEGSEIARKRLLPRFIRGRAGNSGVSGSLNRSRGRNSGSKAERSRSGSPSSRAAPSTGMPDGANRPVSWPLRLKASMDMDWLVPRFAVIAFESQCCSPKPGSAIGTKR